MTAQERTLAALRTDILSGTLPPGTQLVQESIADRYAVSRVPVREALQLLTSEGLVQHSPNRGYFVTELSVTDLHEVYALRRILETHAIAAAVPALTDADGWSLPAYGSTLRLVRLSTTPPSSAEAINTASRAARFLE